MVGNPLTTRSKRPDRLIASTWDKENRMKNRTRIPRRLLSAFFLSAAFPAALSPAGAGVHRQSPAPETVVYECGKDHPAQILIPEASSPQVAEAARHLRRALSEMTGANWEIAAYRKGEAPERGLVVNPDLSEFPVPDAEHADQGYVIFADGKKIEIAAAAPLGIVHGTAAFAHELGYRRFFASKRWEHIPRLRKIALAARIVESPDFATRSIPPTFGVWPEHREDSAQYNWANRHGGQRLRTGHMYGAFAAAREAVFERHPEYYALFGGERKMRRNVKLCISNPGLRAEMVSYVREWLIANPSESSVSMEPSDGGNWCECEACAGMGSVSTRVVALANDAARMIRGEFPGKKIGLYAYNQHSSPPDIPVEPEIVVSIATSFMRDGWTYEQLEKGWREKGVARLGTRDYHDVVNWSDWWTPGKSKAFDTDHCTRMLKRYHEGGSRHYISEGGGVWGPGGLGYVLSMRVLWNVGDADRADEIRKDFLQTMFGPAEQPMTEFYDLIDGKNSPLASEDLLGRMYRHLAGAFRLAGNDPAVTRRVADLALYARHVELLLAMRRNSTPASELEFLRHLARIRPDQMLNTRLASRHAPREFRGSAPSIDWNNPGPAYTLEDILAMTASGVERNKLFAFTPVRYGDEYRPFPVKGTARFAPWVQRGTGSYHVYIANPEKTVDLRITGGLIAHYRDRGNVRVELRQVGGASETGERETLVFEDASVPPDGNAHVVSLRAREAGLHKMVVRDGNDMTRVEWPEGLPVSVGAGTSDRLRTPPGGGLYFYIPPGTKRLGFYANCQRGGLHDSGGARMLEFTKDSPAGYFDLEVPEAEGGKLWSFRSAPGEFALMTVPPMAAISGEELLLPAELVPPSE